MSDPKEKMYEEIGKAVAACQFFEFSLTVTVKLMFKHESATRIEELTTLTYNSFKPAITALLKELKAKIDVSQDFEQAISEFAERRHELIHRWLIKNGWPQNGAEVEKLSEFARKLSAEAILLASLLCSHLIKWLNAFPEFKALAESQEKIWKNMLEQSGFALSIKA